MRISGFCFLWNTWLQVKRRYLCSPCNRLSRPSRSSSNVWYWIFQKRSKTILQVCKGTTNFSSCFFVLLSWKIILNGCLVNWMPVLWWSEIKEEAISYFSGLHFTLHCPLHCPGFFLEVSRSYKWRRQWQPTPVLLPGESHGRRSQVGCSPWGC